MEIPMRSLILRSLIPSSGLVAAALVGMPQAGFAQGREKAFCLQHESGGLQCNYDTMAQCQQGREGRSVGGGCIPNPRLGTTGRSEGGMSPRGEGEMDTPAGEPRR